MPEGDRASINRLADEVAIAARDLRLNTEAGFSLIETLRPMKENIETILAICTEEPEEQEGGSELGRLLRALTARLGGVEAALDRQTAAISAMLHQRAD